MCVHFGMICLSSSHRFIQALLCFSRQCNVSPVLVPNAGAYFVFVPGPYSWSHVFCTVKSMPIDALAVSVLASHVIADAYCLYLHDMV